MKTRRVRPRETRGLFYRKGGWWIDVQINGKRFREYAGPTEAQAKIYRNKLLAWKRDDKNGLPTRKPEGEPIKFAAAADDFFKSFVQGTKKRSHKRDALSLGHLKGFFARCTLNEINADAVDAYRAHRSAATVTRIRPEDGKRFKQPLSVVTINRELACLRTMLRWAVRRGKLPAYPLPADERLLAKEPEFEPRILEPDEIDRLLTAATKHHWLRPAVLVWLDTGLRKMELLRLRHEHVDFKRRTLTVISANSKNGKTRQVPISELVAETLTSMPGETYFFENPETGRNICDLLKPFKVAVKAAGIKGRVRIHDLRDTYATLLLRGGIDIRTVAALIGDTPEVCLKRYCRTNERIMRLAADHATELVFGSRPKVHDAPLEDMQPASESVS